MNSKAKGATAKTFNMIHTLPTCVLRVIISCLNAKDLLRLDIVCKSLKNRIENENLWSFLRIDGEIQTLAVMKHMVVNLYHRKDILRYSKVLAIIHLEFRRMNQQVEEKIKSYQRESLLMFWPLFRDSAKFSARHITDRIRGSLQPLVYSEILRAEKTKFFNIDVFDQVHKIFYIFKTYFSLKTNITAFRVYVEETIFNKVYSPDRFFETQPMVADRHGRSMLLSIINQKCLVDFEA